jgi:uncharacterized protein YneF (UPF0154 family)
MEQQLLTTALILIVLAFSLLAGLIIGSNSKMFEDEL